MLSPCNRVMLGLGVLFVLARLPSALAAEPDKPRLDALGEPLPAEAAQRLGTPCFRNDMSTQAAALSPDGKTIAVVGRSGIVLLDSRTGKEFKRFNSAGFATSSGLIYSPNGKMIAVIGVDGNDVKLVDAELGEILGKLPGSVRDVSNSLSFSADGQRIAVNDEWVDANRHVTVWDADGFKKLHTFEILAATPPHVALSGDGKRLATCGEDDGSGIGNRDTLRTVQLWDTVTGKKLKRIVAETNRVVGVALSPDGKELAVADGNSSSISIWDVETAQVVQHLAARCSKRGEVLRYSPDGKVLVAGSSDGAVQVWETPGYKRLGMARQQNCTLEAVAFLPEKKVLALGHDMQALHVWEAPSGRVLSLREGHTGPITTLQFRGDGKKVLSGGQGGVYVWDPTTGKSERHIAFQDSSDLFNTGLPRVYLLAPNGRTVLTSLQKGNSRLLNLATEEEEYEIDLIADHTGLNAAFSADGKMMAGITEMVDAGHRVGIRVWNLADGRQEALVFLPRGSNYTVALSADGKFVAGATNTYGAGGDAAPTMKLKLWNTATGKELWTMWRQNQWTKHLAFSPDGRLIAKGEQTGFRLLEAAAGGQLLEFENPDHLQINCLTFSPDGRTLAVGSQFQTRRTQTSMVTLWETATGKPRVDFTGHRGPISALAFSPDGRVLASGSSDTTILLWDLTGKLNADVRAAARPKSSEFDTLWNDLEDTDAAKSYRLVQRLSAYPEEAVALVKTKLPAAKGRALDADTIDKMIAQLDHDDFARREEASKFLAEAGKTAAPALTKALEAQPSAEKKRRLMELLEALKATGPTSDMVRTTRALEVLERLGTPEARQLLEELGKGNKDAKLTQDAQATLKRLESSMP
jgi:WD40 repeat protein